MLASECYISFRDRVPITRPIKVKHSILSVLLDVLSHRSNHFRDTKIEVSFFHSGSEGHISTLSRALIAWLLVKQLVDLDASPVLITHHVELCQPQGDDIAACLSLDRSTVWHWEMGTCLLFIRYVSSCRETRKSEVERNDVRS